MGEFAVRMDKFMRGACAGKRPPRAPVKPG